MRKLILFMHVSIDGYVTGPTGKMDFVRVDDQMFEFADKQSEEADLALYGRVTYEMMDAYWPNAAAEAGASKHDIHHSNWYNSVEKLVASRTITDTSKPRTRFINDSIEEEIVQLKNSPGKNIIMFGSPGLAKTMMLSDLIDEYWLFVNPVIRGDGNPLFKNGSPQINLELKSTQALPSGVVMLHYIRK
jgi:dihydrofolate reductase